MNQKIEFYEERANEAAEEARNTPLKNVRERALRSEAAWREMADRALAVKEQRDIKAAEARAPEIGETS